jgi:hypothetical protein
VTAPTLAEIAQRLAAAEPWRPVADAIAAELAAELKALYPKMPEGAAENPAAVTITRALAMVTAARASGSDHVVN